MQHLFIAVGIEIAHIDACRALHLGGLVRNRQAALFQNRAVVGPSNDLGIDHLVEFRRLVATAIHHDHPFRDIDLRRGEPDPGRVIHGLGHVI